MDDKWISPNLPKKLYEILDNYARSDEGRELGYNTGKDIIVELMREWVKDHPQANQLEDSENGEIEFVGTIENKIILQDSVKGCIMVVIDNENKLMCYKCEGDEHNNRYTDFISENKELWPFLKKNKVKYVRVRDNGGRKEVKI